MLRSYRHWRMVWQTAHPAQFLSTLRVLRLLRRRTPRKSREGSRTQLRCKATDHHWRWGVHSWPRCRRQRWGVHPKSAFECGPTVQPRHAWRGIRVQPWRAWRGRGCDYGTPCGGSALQLVLWLRWFGGKSRSRLRRVRSSWEEDCRAASSELEPLRLVGTWAKIGVRKNVCSAVFCTLGADMCALEFSAECQYQFSVYTHTCCTWVYISTKLQARVEPLVPSLAVHAPTSAMSRYAAFSS